MSKLGCPKLAPARASMTVFIAVLSNGSLPDFKRLKAKLELKATTDEIVCA